MIELTESNWKSEVLDSSIPVLVDFFGPSCAPCKAIEPVVVEVEEGFVGRLKVGKMNVQNAMELASRYGVRALPTLILFSKGKPVGQIVGGSLSKRTLIDLVRRAM